MKKNAIRAISSLCLLFAPVVAGAQDSTAYKLPPPRIACGATSGLRDSAGHLIEGSLHKRCDALWQQSLHNGGVGSWRYDDFMNQCSQSCAALLASNPPASVPQLDTLGTQAAQSAASGGSGLTTALLVGGGVAAAIGIGVAVSGSGSNDLPASP